MSIKKIFVIILILLASIGQSQDIHFSQFNETPVILNPALSCTAYDTRVIANYKSQWATVSSPYTTYGISIEKTVKHLKLKKSYVGMSLTVFNDKAGDLGLGTLSANFGVNAVIKTGKYSRISGGIGGGVGYRTINTANMKWESQYDGYKHNATAASGEVTPVASFMQSDVAVGFDYHYAKSERYISAQDGTKFDIGVSAFHFNKPTMSFVAGDDKQYTKFVGHANFDIGIKGAGVALVPSLIYMRQGPSQEINAGFMFKYILKDQSIYTDIKKASAISVGAFYRVGDAFIPAILFQYDKFALGFSYDLNVSKLSKVSKYNGGMEITLRFNTSPGYGRALGNNLKRSK